MHPDQRILDLRRHHEDMDRAVLAAYGWSDIPVPPYCSVTPADHQTLESFSDEVIDRLFALNAKRAHEESVAGSGAAVPGRRSHSRAATRKATLP